MAAQVNEQPQAEVWYVDTGCSNHMCGSKSSFCFLNEDLKSNLLSAGQLQEKGYIITIQKGACEIYDPSRGAIVVVQMGSNRLFPLKIDSVQSFLMAEEKSEAFSAFKSFKARVEKETGRSIKILCTDHGGEYCSNEFEHFCDDQSIRRELTTAYTPQQNGVSERKNRTILNMVRSLLARGKIPKSFWPEAVNWSIHVLNRSPTFSVQNMTPEEAWSGRKPTVDHFKILASKAYKLFNPLMKKIVTSRDVIFYEESTWNWNGQQPTQVIFDNDAEEERQQLLQQQIPTVSIPESPPNDAPTAAETSSTTVESDVVAESRLRRVRKRPAWMQDFEDLKWHKAMNEEIGSIEKNNSWELVELPKWQKSIGVKWVYKTKLNKDGGVDKYKARLVVKGYKQEFGVDYKKVFAPVAKLDTIRLVLSMAAQNSWSIHQLDVKSAFLHGELEEEVYIDQPPGAIICWCFHFSKKYALEILDKFMLKDCNSVITPSEVGLKLSKSGARKRVDSTLYKQIVGSLMYLTSTRPDIMHAVNLINSDYAGDLDDRKNTFGVVFMLNSGAITWSSKKQQIVTLSTTEAEFVAATSSSCQAIWLRRLLEVLYNQQQDQIADILTKPLKPAVFMKLRSMLGVCSSKEVMAASGKALQIDS
ncbi:Retrovirus-related Pol polyprotein from transposon TNT 1-94 [Vitis vinifera]|uniref:Retrovirus-related Pol polyprotein from transposon TNT 1-94 n=1 Tax=Vitis vinifera TaxID=29760 RepID=A0A438DX60_VITVI|nr:Retrovirus-related Pol polyprotein from transposon TNT 1-94 [Vitis vinifera]